MNDLNPVPPQPNGDNKIPIECVRCKQRFSAPMPPIEVSNNLRTSMVIAVHERLIHCPNNKCRQAYTYVFAPQYQVVVGAQAVNDDAVAAIEGSKIIKPSLGLVQ